MDRQQAAGLANDEIEAGRGGCAVGEVLHEIDDLSLDDVALRRPPPGAREELDAAFEVAAVHALGVELVDFLELAAERPSPTG